jgi:hypothetical protein
MERTDVTKVTRRPPADPVAYVRAQLQTTTDKARQQKALVGAEKMGVLTKAQADQLRQELGL